MQIPTINWRNSRGLTQTYLLYRLMLAIGLNLIYALDWLPEVLGRVQPPLFSSIASFYLGLTGLTVLLSFARVLESKTEAQIAVYLDIPILTLLMYSSGGVESGLGLLIAISIALGSLCIEGRTALVFAAIATLAVITERWYSQTTGAVADPSYTQAGLLGVVYFALAFLAHVLSQRLRESERLIEQRTLDLANLAELNEYIIQHMSTGVLAIDQTGAIRAINESASKLLSLKKTRKALGIKDICPSLAASINAQQTSSTFKRQIFQTADCELQATVMSLGQSGQLIFLEDSGALAQQAQQLKLAGLGRLSASIAHEIRNPLSSIQHAAQLLQESAALSTVDQRLATIIVDNTERVNQIIDSVLRLSRRQRPTPEVVNLEQLLRNLASDTTDQWQLAEKQFQYRLAAEANTVFCDRLQLAQILTILSDNAVNHFQRDQDELQIQIDTRLQDEQIELAFCDNGPGISAADLQSIFEPFFTTKASGTGLGLYIARELAEANAIRLTYQAVAQGGSCFRLTFSQAHYTHES